VPIHTWTDTRIEFEIPCIDPDLTPGDYFVYIWYVPQTGPNAGQIQYSPQYKIFTISDHPTVLSVSPAISACNDLITISGSGGFGSVPAQMITPSSPGNPGYGRHIVVDIVAESGTYTVPHSQFYPAGYSDTQIQFYMADLFQDEVDPCGVEPIFLPADLRNFVQDAGNTPAGTPAHCPDVPDPTCPPEVTIPRCDCLALGTYNIYVKAVYYKDMDENNALSCGDYIYQIEKSDPVTWELTDDPYLYKAVPRNIDCSYKDETGGTGIHWNILRLYGGNFGTERGKQFYGGGPNDFWYEEGVRVGHPAWYYGASADPLTKGYEIPFVMWSMDFIKVGFVVPLAWETYFPPSSTPKTTAVWVVTDMQRDGAGNIISGQPTPQAMPVTIQYCDQIRP
jgi:hypothetical protein